MPDQGAFLHHMTHSATVAEHANGLLYDNTYSRLRDDLSYSQFAFGTDFYMVIEVTAKYDPARPTTQLIFEKLSSGNYTHIHKAHMHILYVYACMQYICFDARKREENSMKTNI